MSNLGSISPVASSVSEQSKNSSSAMSVPAVENVSTSFSVETYVLSLELNVCFLFAAADLFFLFCCCLRKIIFYH